MKKVAVIEIGSNGLRYEAALIGGDYLDVLDRKNLRLDLSKIVGDLPSSDARTRLSIVAGQIADLFKRARKSGITEIRCFGTQACRVLDATIPGYWASQGMDVQVLSPADEARFAYLSACQSIPKVETAKRVAVIDVGNGSSDFYIKRGEKETQFLSVDVGASSLMDAFASAGGNIAGIFAKVEDGLRTIPSNFINLKDAKVVLMGGLITKICWLMHRRNPQHRYRASEMNGFSANIATFDIVQEQIFDVVKKEGPMAARAFVDPVETEEWKILHVLSGCKYFALLGATLNFNDYVVCSQGVRHGVLFEMSES